MVARLSWLCGSYVKMTQLFGTIAQELALHQREDAVASLEYEAQARVQDPVYGCVGILCVLQVQVLHLETVTIFRTFEL